MDEQQEILIVVDGATDLASHIAEIDARARGAIASCSGVSVWANEIRVHVAWFVPDDDPTVVALTESLRGEDWKKSPAPVEASLEDQFLALQRQMDTLRSQLQARASSNLADAVEE